MEKFGSVEGVTRRPRWVAGRRRHRRQGRRLHPVGGLRKNGTVWR